MRPHSNTYSLLCIAENKDKRYVLVHYYSVIYEANIQYSNTYSLAAKGAHPDQRAGLGIMRKGSSHQTFMFTGCSSSIFREQPHYH
eukprot:scaffold14830_cov103-Skeletonema_marinoi.AAC.2